MTTTWSAVLPERSEELDFALDPTGIGAYYLWSANHMAEEARKLAKKQPPCEPEPPRGPLTMEDAWDALARARDALTQVEEQAAEAAGAVADVVDVLFAVIPPTRATTTAETVTAETAAAPK